MIKAASAMPCQCFTVGSMEKFQPQLAFTQILLQELYMYFLPNHNGRLSSCTLQITEEGTK